MKQRGAGARVAAGRDALVDVACAPEVDTVLAAIVGAAGLMPSLAAAEAGKRLLLANKEALVTAGPVLMDAARAGGATLLPIDSEHNAIYQCMPGHGEHHAVRRLLLTASGGPFRGRTRESLASITPDQAAELDLAAHFRDALTH